MLLILIPVAWLALVAFFVILCQMAARGDRALPAVSTHPRTRISRSALTILQDAHASAARAHGTATRTATIGLTMRSRSLPRASRSRRPGCVH
jgi:hypothetical protein